MFDRNHRTCDVNQHKQTCQADMGGAFLMSFPYKVVSMKYLFRSSFFFYLDMFLVNCPKKIEKIKKLRQTKEKSEHKCNLNIYSAQISSVTIIESEI
jgi:hypothetical protein